MSDKKEVVVCAAIDLSVDFTWGINEKVTTGVVIPYIVEEIANSLVDAWCEKVLYYDYCGEFANLSIANVMGFVTNLNRFVNPEEALLITGKQNELRFQNRKYLLPEDLY